MNFLSDIYKKKHANKNKKKSSSVWKIYICPHATKHQSCYIKHVKRLMLKKK